MMKAINTALTGLSAASKSIEAGANNIANISSAGSLTPESNNQPYNTQIVTKQANKAGGVSANITTKNPAFIPAYSPDSPFADENGNIGVPNTDLAEEAIKIKLAELSYKANLSVIKTATELQEELLKSVDKKA